MIPNIVAKELKETLLDYLDTTFSFQDRNLADALETFLNDKQKGMFKGPFLNMKLPFRKHDGSSPLPLDISPGFTPYKHQMIAFERLTSKDGNIPKPSLITTGTGSGKTECFLFPVIDHVSRNIGSPGIKAMILYPMNALAFDQARRIAKMIYGNEQLKGRVTAGMYVGGKGKNKTMGPDYVITDKDTLQENPPDILLTNYKMLDYLLMRPEDQALWKDNSPESLRYIVLDELHTYDGVQGGDVACLLRRLRAKLKAEDGAITPVGTSATLSNDDADAMKDLVQFAQNIFGTGFTTDSIITEDRLTASEFFPTSPTRTTCPKSSEEMAIHPSDDLDTYIYRQTKLWFDEEIKAELDVGEQVLFHQFTRTMFDVLDNKILDYDIFRDELAKVDNQFGALPTEDQDNILTSFLALLSYSKRKDNGRTTPLTTIQIQFWIREMRRLMRQITDSPAFFWRDEVPRSSEPKGLPMVYCQECGHSGWVTVKRADDNKISDDNAQIARAVIEERSKKVHYLFPGKNPNELFQNYVCPKCMTLTQDKNCVICGCDGVVVQVHHRVSQAQTPKDMAHCPSCDTLSSLSIAGSQSASLSSVSISHLFQSAFNNDKKLLAFTDSVQDSSHRASFFSARTYRFGLRTAIQSIVENDESGDIPFDDFTDKFFDYWLNELESPADFIATFMPPDLKEIHQYKDFMDSATSEEKKAELEKELLAILHKRLSWEFTIEYGLNLRLGRTLTKSLCSSAYIHPETIETVISDLTEPLQNEFMLLRNCNNTQIQQFILGLLTRLVDRGGIDHPMIQSYIENEKRFLLYKYKNLYMSPFGGNIRLPKFLTSRQGGRIFDCFTTSQRGISWFLDWVRRSLNENIDTNVSNDIYGFVVQQLLQKDVLKEYNSVHGNDNKVYALNPSILGISRNVIPLISPKDGSHQTIREYDKSLWENMPSIAYRGKNCFYEIDESPRGTYYQKVYKSGRIKRIFAQEHSSILGREKREEVESLFKDGGTPDAPNLITCTPTMEMGIDVGDLSATMVCSVPPSTTNYLQRIGRAGRSTGNALVLALANAKPHDLYFYEDPQEMISGIIHTPGCFLNAPEMLKRHFTAFCMDLWAVTAESGDLPNKMASIIKNSGSKSAFPNSFYEHYENHKDEIIEQFLELFSEEDLSDDNKEVIREFAKDNQSVFGMSEVFKKVSDEAEELKRIIDRVKREQKKIEKNPNRYDNADDEIDRCKQEIRALTKQRKELYWGAYPLNVLTNYGVLPNYAFPEDGVKLTSIITGIEVDDGQGGTQYSYDVLEYHRGSATAIKEFAPFNVFYGEGRKVEVDLIETGGLGNSNIEHWRFCNQCSFMEAIRPGDETNACPKCGSQMWKDGGQQHEIIRLKSVGSKVNHIKSLTADETDERDRKTYMVQDFIDIDEKNLVGGFVAEDKAFGFEFVKHVTLTEVNFGLNDPIGQKMTIAGEEIPEGGFVICPDCGIVNKSTDPEKPTPHRRHCKFYGKKADKVTWSNLFIYRQLQSEAIRVLLPVLAFSVPEKLQTFKSALELGFKKLFKGNPGHLLIKEQSEPLNDEEGAFRRYLIICDTVPGGTGYLKDLVYSGGLIKAMEFAFETLTNCSCNENKVMDGCYRCIYAYKHQFQIENISRDRAIRMLEDILVDKDDLIKTKNLSKISIDSVLESELEERFLHTLTDFCSQNDGWKWEDISIKGKPSGLLTIGNIKWKVEPQVKVGSAEGVSEASIPDFMFWPEGENNKGKATALFLDGYKYHVSPNKDISAMSGDIRKRQALIDADNFNVWTLTWYDLDGYKDGLESQNLFSNVKKEINKIMQELGVTSFQESHLNINAISSFFNYLTHPNPDDWEKIALGIVALQVTSNKVRRDPQDIEDAIQMILEEKNVQGLLDLSPSEDTDNPFAEVIQKQFVTHLSSAPITALTNKDSSQVQLFTRIETDKESRQNSEYQPNWRMFWQTVNLIQYIKGLILVAKE